MQSLESRLKARAKEIGFDLAGIAPATPGDGFARLQDWLARGYAGEMDYMHRHGDARGHPASIMPEVRSVLMVALNYNPPPTPRGESASPMGHPQTRMSVPPIPCTGHPQTRMSVPPIPCTGHPQTRMSVPPIPCTGHPRGSQSLTPRLELAQPPAARIARYALGPDYHDVLRDKLKQLLAWLQEEAPGCRGRGVVDTAPLLERDYARRAGLGWFGKNTMLLHPKLGSYFFLGALLLDIELQADAPFSTSHCGTCTACLDACPTEAFVGPGVLDSRRCISYLTIELRGAIDAELRPGMGDWLFGCDICQEVCPWNRKAPAAKEFTPHSELLAVDPVGLLSMDENEFRRRFRHTALWRSKRAGLVRNAAIVLGNTADATALPALHRAMSDTDPVVREAVAWAIAAIQARLAGERGSDSRSREVLLT
jgi:epoxyqueuosine reductase